MEIRRVLSLEAACEEAAELPEQPAMDKASAPAQTTESALVMIRFKRIPPVAVCIEIASIIRGNHEKEKFFAKIPQNRALSAGKRWKRAWGFGIIKL